MVQAESDALGCVCTECGYRCRDCLGTDTVVPRERIAALAADPRFSPERLTENFRRREAEEPDSWMEDGEGRDRYTGNGHFWG